VPFLPAQPPLNLFGLPARYASALYTAASKAGNIPVVQAEFKTLIDAANGDPKFKTFLEDPTMSKAKKIAGLTAFCDGAGFAPVTKSFLCVVAENGRLAENQKIYDALEEYTLAAAGQVKATVTSAQALTPEQLKELTAKLRKHVDSGGELKVETKVDSRLVGGFTVAMGEDFFDLSLMSRIRQMEAELSKPVGA
jgi:F-type H+-transporting ATPase subunit O